MFYCPRYLALGMLSPVSAFSLTRVFSSFILPSSRRLNSMTGGSQPDQYSLDLVNHKSPSGGGEVSSPRSEQEEAQQTMCSPGLDFEALRIVAAHEAACEAEQDTYIDPQTGYTVFTKIAHLKRGKCCGSGCRHCPYGQQNVKDSSKKKQFNSYFYT